MSSLTPKDLAAIRRWLAGQGFVRPEEYRDSFLQRRVRARLDASGIPSVPDLLEIIERDPRERAAFLQKFLIPTTEFLRNPEVLEEAVRLLALKYPGRSLQVLSAGSSTGEEAYSLVALILRAGLDGRVLALDRSLPALRTLRSGIYEARGQVKVDKNLLARYFIRGDRGFSAGRELVSRVWPACWDLGCGLPAGPFHAVFLRNVLIYMSEEAKGRLIGEVAAALLPGGLLVMGRSESAGRWATGKIIPLDREKRIYERPLEGVTRPG